MVARSQVEGQKFGRLTAIKFLEYREKGHTSIWLFLCECGVEIERNLQHVKFGITQSCGCLNSELSAARKLTHGKTGTKVYRTWAGMKRRCYNQNEVAYVDYGARGIRVCDRWLNSFENFLEDMGEPPSPQHSIDRFPNQNGNYEPGNCRWASRKEQNLNYARNVLVEYRGQTKPLKEWTDQLGLRYDMVRQRIVKLKWTPERAFAP